MQGLQYGGGGGPPRRAGVTGRAIRARDLYSASAARRYGLGACQRLVALLSRGEVAPLDRPALQLVGPDQVPPRPSRTVGMPERALEGNAQRELDRTPLAAQLRGTSDRGAADAGLAGGVARRDAHHYVVELAQPHRQPAARPQGAPA